MIPSMQLTRFYLIQQIEFILTDNRLFKSDLAYDLSKLTLSTAIQVYPSIQPTKTFLVNINEISPGTWQSNPLPSLYIAQQKTNG